MVNCLVVDDEPLARNILENYIKRHTDLQLVKSCSTPAEAFEIISMATIDLLFLDIRMPAMNGMDFIKTLKNPPPVIFTTAFAEFAVDSYDLEAVDYLLKPITFERFSKSVARFLKTSLPPESKKNYYYFKIDGRLVKIEHACFIYAQSIKDYLLIHTSQGKFITHMTMKYLAELLPRGEFRRVHRSYLVGIKQITAIENNTIKIGATSIPIGDSYKQEISLLRNDLLT